MTSAHTSNNVGCVYIDSFNVARANRKFLPSYSCFSPYCRVHTMCPSGSTISAAADLLPDIRSAFDILDVDRDGKISCDDLRSFYSGLNGSNGKEMDICSMIKAADSNKDGFVGFDEFQLVLNSGISKGKEASPVLTDVFKAMDRDGDGKVGFADLKSYMKWAGFPVSDEDINNMIKLGGGGDADGVSYQGLLNILALDSIAGV